MFIALEVLVASAQSLENSAFFLHIRRISAVVDNATRLWYFVCEHVANEV